MMTVSTLGDQLMRRYPGMKDKDKMKKKAKKKGKGRLHKKAMKEEY